MANAPPLPPPLPPSLSPYSQSQILSLFLSHHPSSLKAYLPPPHEPSQQPPPLRLISLQSRSPIRLTSEFDSGSSIFFHKMSSKLFNGLAKLKFSFQNNVRGHIANPQLAFFSKLLAINFDLQQKNALVQGVFSVGNLLLTAVHNVKARQGELTVMGNLSEPGYRFVLASSVPSVDPPKVTLKFPCGEVSLQEIEDDKEKRSLSITGIVIGPILHGGCTALYKDGSLNIRYSYKDDDMSFMPCVSLPSNAVSFAFKRYFGPTDKLSYWYNFDNNYWSAVYKHKFSKDYKLKVGYDSAVKLGWASFWIGGERGRLKLAPMKLKTHLRLEVPQDDIKSSVLMFRVKKRWDI